MVYGPTVFSTFLFVQINELVRTFGVCEILQFILWHKLKKERKGEVQKKYSGRKKWFERKKEKINYARTDHSRKRAVTATSIAAILSRLL